MECSCEIDCDFDEAPPEFAKSDQVIARKNHVCSECHSQIAKGQEYTRDTGKWDGEFLTYRACKDCKSLRDKFFTGGWVYEQIREGTMNFIQEINGDIPESCIAELAPGAKAFVCEAIEECWEDTTSEEV